MENKKKKNCLDGTNTATPVQNNGQTEHAAGDFDNASVGSGNSNLSTGALQVGATSTQNRTRVVNISNCITAVITAYVYMCVRACLQNIREQMAASLERMRELEEQVKAIPMLQVNTAAIISPPIRFPRIPAHHAPHEEKRDCFIFKS